tara:strand:+ start:1478 stop:2044 length:567 start_codon:yes stop_codon:yes gene_type:complete
MANFWSTNNVEPKRNFRFKVQITGLTKAGADTDVVWWAKTVTTPSFDVSEVEHNYLDNKFYFPGRVSWNEVSMTLVDPISVDAVAVTNQLLVNSGYSVKANTNNLSTMSKKKSTTAGIEQITIEILDAEGTSIETWTLKQPFIKSAKYGDLDYSSDDLRTVEMTVRYDWAECVTKNPSGTPGTFFEKS